MALSQEVSDNLAFAHQIGFDKMHLAPPAQTRELMKHAPKNPNPTQVGEVINTTITENKIPVRIYIPEGHGLFPTISFFHGGGFTLMSLDSHDEICRQLCARTNAVVMSVDYALAPENPYPAGINDCVNATKWFINNAMKYQGDGSKMAVAGDSAGGYMAISTAQKLKSEGINLKAQVVVYPVTDHYSAGHPSWVENKEGYILSSEMMQWFWDNFITDPNKYEEASPLRTLSLEGLPPAFIVTANYDPLRDEGKAYADKLEAAGVEVIYENYENVHGFYGTGEMGQDVMNQSVAFLKHKFND
ncbi:MAG: alpha/beta hydrolase [Saprospiraceae bacterium]|nr:alpha/beta hydrolase [Saprospiraceae bacterium]